MSTGAIVGIAIGTVGLALIIGIVLFVLRRRNAASKKSSGEERKSIHYSEMDNQESSYALDIQAAKYAHVAPSELQELGSPIELAGHDRPRELPA
jgi:LPXTG-motif cell wall-anchored protein